MYETHFGLKKRPFRAHAAGTDVFVGPQTAATIAGLKKALTNQDSIVAVSGPIGVGKTTLVRRALDAVGNKQTLISLGRMHLGHDEVLELLLEEMGVTLPAGTVQRFTAFRRLLKEQSEQGSRVIVVVEDATRIGTDALSELEALTASDAGVSDGANIVLMGDQGINAVLNTPQLARLKQRLRLRQSIAPFSRGELTGYLKHCFRLAGQEYDTVFEDGTATTLHVLSEGIARMANNLVESALTAAADAKVSQVSVALIERVAVDEYGLEVALDQVANEHHIRERRTEDRRAADRRIQNQQIAEPIVQEPSPVPEAIETPVADTEPNEAPTDEQDEEIPELIQDTLPDLAVLAPALVTGVPPEAPVDEIAAAPSSAPVRAPETAAPERQPQMKTEPQSEPELTPEIAAALEAAQVGESEDEIPEWERDPTLAELRPDLDALEHAML
ncbi:MAG: AAA family ATPase, partial [Gammaproteobacteria bacterium]|nr:AAA family ATPase [Gammaproteobacteria bacterium]